MPKNMIGQPQFNRAILVQNPNPMEVEQFKTPEAPIKKENQKSLRNFLNDHEKNFSQVRFLLREGVQFLIRKSGWNSSVILGVANPLVKTTEFSGKKLKKLVVAKFWQPLSKLYSTKTTKLSVFSVLVATTNFSVLVV